jgi:plastocyanin
MPHRRTLAAAGSLLCAVLLMSCEQSEPAANHRRPTTHTVIMEGMVFQPEVATVAAGDTVVWINKDMVSHTVTAGAGGFDSKVIAAFASWRHTFEQAGDFDYVCSLHPTMTAKLHVR